jgi:hypothetical protein
LFVSILDEVDGVVELILMGIVGVVEWAYGKIAKYVYAEGIDCEDLDLW